MGFTKDIIGTNESVGGINLFEKVQSTQPATPYTAGLMSATDKSKLDSLENYVHPDSGVVPGKYMQVDVNEQGHVVAGRELQNSTLEDYRIKDAYIDLSDNSIVLGSHRIKPITPSDKVRWEQIVDTPNTLKEFGVTDVALSDGTINIGGDLITPLTADSQIAADKIAGVIDLKNIPVGAMERCVVVEDDAARFALTTNDVQKGDTVKVINPTPTMYMVVDESKLDSADGYVVYSAGNANSVPWGGITDKPDQFYTLPKADTNTLGGVIIGDNITVDADGKISTHSPYRLPQASDTVLGGVKIGENILEQPDGTINISTATTNAPGVVKIGDNINIDDDGTISTEKYQLPTATNMRLGGVRIGKYLSVDSEGLLNATGVPITASKTDMGGVIIGENIDIDKNGKISVTLPTKTSELENDSDFITTENLSLHNNDENAHASKFEAIASKFEAMHGQLVNVKQFGAKGDGVTDDTAAIQTAIDNNPNTTIYFPKGIYLVSQTIITRREDDKKVYLELDMKATIKATSSFNGDYIFYIAGSGTETLYRFTHQHTGIHGGVIDCNSVTGGVRLGRSHESMFSEIFIINCPTIGFWIEDNYSADTYLSKIMMYATKDSNNIPSGQIGLKVDAYDNNIEYVRTCDFNIGIQINGGGNWFRECHPLWTGTGAGSVETSEGTVGYDNYGPDTHIISCYQDKFSIGIKLNNNNRVIVNTFFDYHYPNPWGNHYSILNSGSVFNAIIDNLIVKFNPNSNNYIYSGSLRTYEYSPVGINKVFVNVDSLQLKKNDLGISSTLNRGTSNTLAVSDDDDWNTFRSAGVYQVTIKNGTGTSSDKHAPNGAGVTGVLTVESMPWKIRADGKGNYWCTVKQTYRPTGVYHEDNYIVYQRIFLGDETDLKDVDSSEKGWRQWHKITYQAE